MIISGKPIIYTWISHKLEVVPQSDFKLMSYGSFGSSPTTLPPNQDLFDFRRPTAHTPFSFWLSIAWKLPIWCKGLIIGTEGVVVWCSGAYENPQMVGAQQQRFLRGCWWGVVESDEHSRDGWGHFRTGPSGAVETEREPAPAPPLPELPDPLLTLILFLFVCESWLIFVHLLYSTRFGNR